MEEQEQLKQTVANNIAQLRKSKGLTQLELAERLNYSDKAVSKWERGEGLPDVLVLPCEGFVRALCRCRGLEFGRVKTCFVLTMVAAAALVSLLALGSIHGLREGTVMCALTVGGFSRFFSRRLHFLLTPGVE